MNCKMKFRITVIACGTALLLAAAVAVVVALRNRQQSAPPPDVPVAASPAEVRVKAVERNVETLDFSNAEAAKFLSRGPRRTSTEFGISDYIKFLAERSGKMPLVGACVALIVALLLVGFFIAIS